MDQLLEIPDSIIDIVLGVVSHRLAVVGVLTDSRETRRSRWSQAVPKLADMLAACGVDQAIDGVIDIVAVRVDDLTIEVDRLLGIVADGVMLPAGS